MPEGKTLSLQDILQQRQAANPDIEEARRKQELTENGCVIRAIESATGRKATPQEQDARLRATRGSPTEVDILVQSITPEVGPEEISARTVRGTREQLARDMENVRQYAKYAAAKSGHKVTEQRMSPAQIREALRFGQSVVVNGALHTAHVVEQNGSLVSTSDEGAPAIELDGRQRYTTFTFRKGDKQ